MRVALLTIGAGVLILVPLGTAVLLILFPDEVGSVPVWLWLVWLVISLGVAVEAPALADALAPPGRGIYGSISYAKWTAALGALNVASALAALFLLRSTKFAG